MGSAYRLHRRTCYTKKEPPRRISEVLKVAATYSPTIFRSAVPSAMLSLCFRPSPLRCLPTRSLSRPRAYRRPPSASDAFFLIQRPPLAHDYIKSMVSLLNKVYYRTADFYLSVLYRSSVGGESVEKWENGEGYNNEFLPIYARMSWYSSRSRCVEWLSWLLYI